MAYAQHEDEQEGTVLPGNFSNTPVVRPNWRVDQHTPTAPREMAAYRVAHHAPRIARLAIDGMWEYSRHAGAIYSDDPGMAPWLTKMEREVGNELVAAVGRYIRRSVY